MPQSTILSKTRKSRAPVIALDARRSDQLERDERRIQNLHLAGLLSRSLEVEHIIDTFAREIQQDVPHSGYKYECIDIEKGMSAGQITRHSVHYRLKVENQLLGEVTLFRDFPFVDAEVTKLEALLCALIYPIRNAVTYQTALKSAHRDPLSGLNNRTSMDKFLPREIEMARRHDQSMALLAMDLDGFKGINDRCGHDVGDQVLRDVGGVVQNTVRNTDLFYRYGGDEFVGGLAQTDINGALDVGERIRRGVEKIKLPSAREGKKSSVRISIGITMIRPDDCFRVAFKRADQALYKAKAGGKNRIIIE